MIAAQWVASLRSVRDATLRSFLPTLALSGEGVTGVADSETVIVPEAAFATECVSSGHVPTLRTCRVRTPLQPATLSRTSVASSHWTFPPPIECRPLGPLIQASSSSIRPRHGGRASLANKVRACLVFAHVEVPRSPVTWLALDHFLFGALPPSMRQVPARILSACSTFSRVSPPIQPAATWPWCRMRVCGVNRNRYASSLSSETTSITGWCLCDESGGSRRERRQRYPLPRRCSGIPRAGVPPADTTTASSRRRRHT